MVDVPSDVLVTLYTADPDQFLSVRNALAADAKQSGDMELSRAITAQRKPTVAAWVVNTVVHDDATTVDRLVDLGARLRAAHEQLDPGTLRDLSTERRQLVAEVSRAALSRAGREDAGAALRDEVTDTLDAAVADPQIAARLGRLTRAEKWSGFGVAMQATPGAPELTVIRGGRDRPKKARDATRTRTVKAADALAAADAALQDSEQAERTAAQRVRDLTAELERMQQQLAAAEREHTRSRQDVRSARARRREAQSALTRAQRTAE